MSRRFDRADTGDKVQMQTMCGLAGLDFRLIGAHDYAQLFLLGEQLDLPIHTRTEMFRRMVFNVAAANCDDHTKNFSFLLPHGGDWQLSPAYDVTHAHSATSRWTREHLMAVNGRRTGIERADVLEVGDRFAVPGYKDAFGDVIDAVTGWPTFAGEAAVPDQLVDAIALDIEESASPLR
jgi:serine/threonine-protein kinase HipA